MIGERVIKSKNLKNGKSVFRRGFNRIAVIFTKSKEKTIERLIFYCCYDKINKRQFKNSFYTNFKVCYAAKTEWVLKLGRGGDYSKMRALFLVIHAKISR